MLWNTLFIHLLCSDSGEYGQCLFLWAAVQLMEQWSGEIKIEGKEQLKWRRGRYFAVLQPLLHHCLFWMLWPIGNFQSPCLNDLTLSHLLTFTPATDGEEQRNSRESWTLFSGQFWLVWKATPRGDMWLRWQICSDLPPWHQVHQCRTGWESLLRMGRDQTKGSVLLKAQLLVQLKEMVLWA